MDDSDKEQLTDEFKTVKRGLELIVQEAIRTKELVHYNDVNPCYALPLLIDYIVATYTKVEKANKFLEKEKNPKA